MTFRRITIFFLIFLLIILCLFSFFILKNLRPIPEKLEVKTTSLKNIRLKDINGFSLTTTYQEALNTSNLVELDSIPILLRQAIVLAEDKRFFQHGGTDWLAVLHALTQNIRAGRIIRGASSISEQTISILHPRPRKLSSKILECIEAKLLERKLSKTEILAFYLNQLPYPDQARGVVQAAHTLFDKDLQTLSLNEIISLAVLPRAPQALHPKHHPGPLKKRMLILAEKLYRAGLIKEEELEFAGRVPELKKKELFVKAPFFVDFVRKNLSLEEPPPFVKTTLDGFLQNKVQKLLDARVKTLKKDNLFNGAVLIINHKTGHIKAMAVASDLEEKKGGKINAVFTPRQAGSTLKPFAYAMALERGWTAASLISDTPISIEINEGSHEYHNYSRTNYGKLPLRDALANSLNLAAIRIVRHVGVDDFLKTLQRCGLKSLDRDADFYGDGLVLGNGEVSLFELCRAYSLFASDGKLSALSFIKEDKTCENKLQGEEAIFSRDTARLIALILSDPEARKLEFGPLMSFPVQTAIKTGTSSNHKDLWAIGFDSEHLVGIWMGNLDASPTDKLSGASGPLPLLRSIFAELNRNKKRDGLPQPLNLKQRDICLKRSKEGHCLFLRSEWLPSDISEEDIALKDKKAELKYPPDGLSCAIDPRVDIRHQYLPCKVEGIDREASYLWFVNDVFLAESKDGSFLWPLSEGFHEIKVRVLSKEDKNLELKARIRVY